MNNISTQAHLRIAMNSDPRFFETPRQDGRASFRVTDNVMPPDTDDDYRKNRQETLQLCDAFQAFYADNPAYRLAL